MRAPANLERWSQIEAAFHCVTEIPGSERQQFMASLAAADPDLAQEVESLVKAAERAGEFLERADDLTSCIREAFDNRLLPLSESVASSSDATDTNFPDNEITRITSAVVGSGAVGINGDHNQEVWPSRISMESVASYLHRIRPEIKIAKQVGEGAAGIVLQATDSRLNRTVAIKALHRDWAEKLGTDALRRETQAAGIAHENIVRVFEVSPPQSTFPYIVMEWIDGPSLKEHLAEQGALAAKEAAWIAREIALGLGAAHASGLVHGDIKPANIMLEPLIGGMRAKLTDFGLARRVDRTSEELPGAPESATEHFEEKPNRPRFAGTPAYASPEQLLRGCPASETTDVWMVGATLYHMLCGVPPFSGRPHTIARQMQAGPPTPPRSIDPRLPRDIESICLKALAINPAQRYVNAAELAADLNRFLTNQVVHARPLSRLSKGMRFARREPVLASLVAGLLTVMLVGTFVSNHYRVRAETNLASATLERDRALAVSKLMRGMISSSDTYSGDPNVKMIDALLGLESRLATELVDQPAIEADLRSNLGAMFFSIGAYEKSVQQFEQAILLRKQNLHESYSATNSGNQEEFESSLRDKIELANSYRWLYQEDRAMETAQSAFDESKKLLGMDHQVTIHAMEVVAGCFKDNGKLQESLDIYRTALERSKEPVQRSLLLSGYAGALLDLGRFVEAESFIKNAIASHKEDGGKNNRETLVLLSNLGVTLVELGKTDEALRVQEECADKARELLGPAHDLTVTAWLNYGETLRRSGDVLKALGIYQEFSDLCSRDLGPSHPKTLDAIEGAILLMVRMERHEQALELTDMTLSRVEEEFPPNDDRIHKLRGCRAAALSGLRRFEDALPLYESTIQHFHEKLGPKSLTVLVYRNNYALALVQSGEAERAVPIYRELLSLSETLQMPALERMVNRNFGLALARSGHAEAGREVLIRTRDASILHGETDNATKCDEYLHELAEG